MKRIRVIIALLATGLIFASCGTALASSGTIFRVKDFYKDQFQKWVRWGVVGIVPSDIDLSDDIIAKNILREAVQFALTQKEYKNPYPGGERLIRVFLHQGKQTSPLTVSFISEGGKEVQLEIFAECNKLKDEEEIIWDRYQNNAQKSRIKEKRLAEQKEREIRETEAKKRETETRKAKEEQEKQEAKKRLDEFVSKNEVTTWLSIRAVGANPFVYEGKIVAVPSLVFTQMLTPTQGIFAGSGLMEAIVVSDIPKGLFTLAGTVVIIAGRVLGKTEIKNPLGGTISVPHLKFVGVHLCKNFNCRDILN